MAKLTKEQIIQKTKKYLININSFRFTSLHSILKEIGISKGVFYYHFKSKDELFYEALIPEIYEKEQEFNKIISKLDTFREKIFAIFGVLTDDTLRDKLKILEDFYVYLFFENNINKTRTFKKIYITINKNRKSMILQQIKYHNIKITKDIICLTDYLIDTLMFYHLFYKQIKGRNPTKEVIQFLNMFCNILEGNKQKLISK